MAIIELFLLIGEVVSGLFNRGSKRQNEIQAEDQPNRMDQKKPN